MFNLNVKLKWSGHVRAFYIEMRDTMVIGCARLSYPVSLERDPVPVLTNRGCFKIDKFISQLLLEPKKCMTIEFYKKVLMSLYHSSIMGPLCPWTQAYVGCYY